MEKKNPTGAPSEQKPVSEKFGKFEQNYGGDAVNAHNDRMDSLLHDNAKQLEGELGAQKGKDS